ncbi:MAG TPA: hypothetical protein VLA13_08510 [Massilibacterium sp.]|nr:hypothetical protein [Massilibacterium sp.]
MIKIKKGSTADTRTCDWSIVTKEQLLESSKSHIDDIQDGLHFFAEELRLIGKYHDFDKITAIDHFHEDFKTGFEQTGWWDNHRKVNRHHLNSDDGVPDDVNLLDVLEFITDCVMAGMARKGEVYPLEISDEILKKAFNNTVDLLKNEIKVVDE